MYTAVVLLMVMAGAQALSYADVLKAEWRNFISEYDKSYSAEEELLRFEIFKDNKNMIAKHNERYAAGKESYELGLNEFADLLSVEFERYMLRSLITSNTNEKEDNRITYIPAAHVTVAENVDWRAKGAVTPVKSQGQCGSCWAFSTTGVLEGQHFRKTGKLISLSEQNLVDCSTGRYYNNGCHGGWPYMALHYIKDNRGIDTEESYPYRAADGSCHFERNHIGATVRGVSHIDKGSESALQHAVATIGPISACLDATGLQFYKSGVYYNPRCSRRINHAVLIVGYGTVARSGDYWLVKNSWGGSWGENGYFRISRNKNSHCGIADFSIFPVV